MSDTDIYKKREAMPYGSGNVPQKPKRRRKKSRRQFDDQERKRRSKNKGIRRLLHLSRKKENEKYYWGFMITFIVVLLVAVILWQFVILNIKAESENEQMRQGRAQKEQVEETTAPETSTAEPLKLL